MLEIQIIKIEDPGCLWARVLKGSGIQPDSPEEYENLRVKMNLFYHEVDLDVQKLKPAELKEGLVCVVFSLALKSWCRAVVESVSQGTVDTQAWCLLVDHGDRIIVGAEDVRTPLEKFLQLPFRVRCFKLAGIRPMTLQVPVSENTAELVPSSTWDSSATKYLHNLLQVSTLVEAVLCETQAGCSAIELYLTINNTKLCVNHELVAKKFACFLKEESSALEGNRNGDRAPISLAWDIYSSPHQLLEMKGCCPVKPPPFSILTRKEQKDDPRTETEDVSHLERQKPQLSEEADMLSQVNPRVSKLARNAGTDTIGRGWRIRAEATDIFTDERCAQTNIHKPQYMKFNTLSHSKQIPQSFEEQQHSPDQTDNNSIASTPAASSSCASDSSEEQKVAAPSQESSLEDQLTSSRLMQFLNPDPLNPAQESLDAKVVRCDPGHSGVLVHAALRVEPCSNLTRAPISEKFRKPIAVILCPGWEKVQTVLELLEDSKATYNLHPTSVLLGVDQEEPKKFKIQRNCQLLVTTPFTMMRLLDAQCFLFLRLCHLVLDEADVLYSQAPEQMSVILKHFQKVVSGEERSSCPRQIIAVGSRWSAGIEALVREHMIYPSIIITVMEEAALYGRVHQRVQLCLDCDKISVLLGSLDFHPPKPQKTLIITNSAEETEHVYKAVVNTAVFTLKAHEDVTDQFDFVIDQWRKDIGHGTQVILVTTNDCLKALGIRDATCVVHYGFPSSPKLFGSRLFCLSENFRNLPDMDHAESSSPAAQSVLLLSELNARHVCGVLRYLRRSGAVLPPELLQFALVTTNDCLKALGIRDATCVVHYGFPSSPKLFGSRLFCLSENFRNLPDMDHAESSSPAAQSVLLLSELNARHVCGVLRYLRRSGALLPPELLQFALGVQQAKEEQKTDRPLCSSLKSFGFCRDSTVCPDRHMINKSLDHPKHPDSGTVMVLPLCIKSANVYSGRIVSQKDDGYETLAVQMNAHYAIERRCAVEVLKGELYAVQEENIYNRVRVIEVPEKGEQLFSSVTACFIDEGRTQEVKSHQLLQLPPQFQDLPGQAVEIILCRAQPVDGEVDWNPKVTRAISQKIKGKLHQARVVMSVGNTVWVDPMVRMTRVPGLKTYINEYNVHAEIVASGFGVNNPQHLDLLKRVFQGDENANTLQHLTDDRFESPSSSSQQRIEVTEDVLTSRMKDLVSSHNAMDFSQTPISPQNNSAVQCNGDLKDSDDDDEDESSEGSMNTM
ncbi:putative ATP-dependent RNA helicase TDRD12, partial [Sinocyclocheilus rhinocerous]|uniref:putative ATP-dependent RNA helicase TDRD12 n=1 Tax=Sinocyclocheilus rhinocerous TaxID=307959 RepID=UPI0007B99B5E